MDADCQVASGCTSAASTAGPDTVEQDEIPAPTPVPVNLTNNPVNPTNQNTAPVKPVLWNFVADSKHDCEESIEDRLHQRWSCRYEGGCGISCGVPGANCPTANPNSWGACIDPTKTPVYENLRCVNLGITTVRVHSVPSGIDPLIKQKVYDNLFGGIGEFLPGAIHLTEVRRENPNYPYESIVRDVVNHSPEVRQKVDALYVKYLKRRLLDIEWVKIRDQYLLGGTVQQVEAALVSDPACIP